MSEIIEFGIISNENEKICFESYLPEKYCVVNVDEDIFAAIYMRNSLEFEQIQTQVSSKGDMCNGIGLYNISVLDSNNIECLREILLLIYNDQKSLNQNEKLEIDKILYQCDKCIQSSHRMIIYGL